MPQDLVLYGDFDDPGIPNASIDASAASLITSALYELSTFVPKKQKLYCEVADKMMNSLKDKYSAEPRTKEGYILTNSTDVILVN